jgi:hypothetical protein
MECVKSCIYGIKYDGKIVYVGRHNTPNHVERWKQHIKQSKRNASCLLHKKMVEYGVEKFSIEKICECDTKDVGSAEIRYIQEHNTLIPNGYNMQKGGASKNPQPKVLRKCSYTGCNFTTLQRTKFDIHTRTHTGEKPYKCDIEDCEYAAIRRDELELHIKVHYGIRPYKCNVPDCNFSSTRSGPLLKHSRRHNQENHINIV